ncbi:MAG: OadG family transporter subunit [Bacteroidales bacterium]
MRKKKFQRLFVAIILTFCLPAVFAQKTSDLRINEIMAINTDHYVDDFGVRSAWIEVFNSSYGSIDIGGCYLSDDINNLKKYVIPKGDVKTLIKPRQHLVFWADNNPSYGTFHLNFKLDNVGFFVLTSSDGHTIIDSVSFPLQSANVSYARNEDGAGVWEFEENATPSTNNKLIQLEAANERFLQYDPFGIAMALTAMSVVFTALFALFLIFKLLAKILNFRFRKKSSISVITAISDNAKTEPVAGAVYAAIVAAMEMYHREVSELESNVLTINRVAKAYSPWSSKFYGLRKNPSKK